MGGSWHMISVVSIQTVQRDFPVFISGQLRLLKRFLLCQFIPRDSLSTLWIRRSILIRSEGKHKNQSFDSSAGALQIPCAPGVQLPASPSGQGGCPEHLGVHFPPVPAVGARIQPERRGRNTGALLKPRPEILFVPRVAGTKTCRDSSQ